jgi:hypothetical protein
MDEDTGPVTLSLKLRPDQVEALKAYALRANPEAEADRAGVLETILARRSAKARRHKRLTEADLMAQFGVEAIATELEAAAMTQRHLTVKGFRPAQLRSGWPDVVQSSWDVYNSERAKADLKDEEARIVPTADAISRMDRAIHWLNWLNERERKIVWARAMGLTLRIVARKFGCNKDTIHADYVAALLNIAIHLHSVSRQL